MLLGYYKTAFCFAVNRKRYDAESGTKQKSGTNILLFTFCFDNIKLLIISELTKHFAIYFQRKMILFAIHHTPDHTGRTWMQPDGQNVAPITDTRTGRHQSHQNQTKTRRKRPFFLGSGGFWFYAVQITVFWAKVHQNAGFWPHQSSQNRPPDTGHQTPARTGGHHARQPSPTTRARAGKNLIEQRANNEKMPPAASVSR